MNDRHATPDAGPFGILAVRSGASIFGAAQSFCKMGDCVMSFPTRDAARAEADRLNRRTVSPNVWYCVEPLPNS